MRVKRLGGKKMNKVYSKIIAFVLAMAMVVTGAGFDQITALAAAYLDSTPADGEIEATVNAEVFFVSVANGKLITLDGVMNNPIDVKDSFTTPAAVPKSGLFTVYYGSYNDYPVVNFTCGNTQTAWKSDGNNIYQIDKSNATKASGPSGWESVRIFGNGDGTVSFSSSTSKAGNVFTIDGTKLGHSGLSISDNLSANEKFYMYTKVKPKKARKVKISNISGDSIDLAWEAQSNHLYSGYQVLFATKEAGPYTKYADTADTSITIENLNVNTQYFFKVRTITNNKEDATYSAYADSEVVYANTLKDANPAKPIIDLVTRNADGKQVISWKKANNTNSYNIYRSTSRYGEYTKIGETNDLMFIDNNPNTSSKYDNYYKVQGVNGDNAGELSNPGSLEISQFGYNTYVFSEKDDKKAIDKEVNQIYQNQHTQQFGPGRYQYFFKPDQTGDGFADFNDLATIKVGYYTALSGLGKVPYDVEINNVQAPAALSNNNATCNFWVAIENMRIANKTDNPSGGTGLYDFLENTFVWSVSQAAPARRLVVDRNSAFDWNYGWASGGYFSDTVFNGQAGSYSQQQYYYRNCEFNGTDDMGVYGINWNQVIQGCKGVKKDVYKDNSGNLFNHGKELLSGKGYTNWQSNGCTTVIDKTDKSREKPFMYFDSAADEYKVFVPAVRKNTVGVSYTKTDMGEGKILNLDSFYIADPNTDTADTINEKLGMGYNLILKPGIFKLDKELQVCHENTIILGLGMATLTSTEENTSTFIKVKGFKDNGNLYIDPKTHEIKGDPEDIGGVEISGIVLDAGYYTDSLIEMGYEGANVNHENNPCVLQDVICRVGGTGELGRTGACMVINSNDTIIDQTWVWRADHGDNTGWYANTAKNGIVVNGDNIYAFGLFVEHFQEYDILWRGENGQTIFLQNEKCYDPQSQSGWMSHAGTKNGYAAYKVANNVKNHYSVGMGVYDVFINTNGASIFLDNAIEVPDTPGVLIENACIVEIANGSGPRVGINNIINDTCYGITTGEGTSSNGASTVNGGYAIQRLFSYSNRASKSLPDAYTLNSDNFGADGLAFDNEEIGVTPTRDNDAEKDIVKEALTADKSDKPLDNYENQDHINEVNKYTNWYNSLRPEPQPESSTKAPKPTGDDPNVNIDIKPGTEFVVGKYKYRVTAFDKKAANYKAEIVGFSNDAYKKTEKKIAVPKTATYRIYTFNVTSVGKKAFAKCKKVTKVTLGAKVTNVKASAFASCKKLKTIKLKASLKTIGTKAFMNAKKVTKLVIPKKVTKIGKSAFAGCAKLKTVTIGKKVKNIMKKAFYKDNKLKKIVFKGKALKKVAKNAISKKVKGKLSLKGNKKSIKVFKKKLKIK